jgi:hypothetical protein
MTPFSRITSGTVNRHLERGTFRRRASFREDVTAFVILLLLLVAAALATYWPTSD